MTSISQNHLTNGNRPINCLSSSRFTLKNVSYAITGLAISVAAVAAAVFNLLALSLTAALIGAGLIIYASKDIITRHKNNLPPPTQLMPPQSTLSNLPSEISISSLTTDSTTQPCVDTSFEAILHKLTTENTLEPKKQAELIEELKNIVKVTGLNQNRHNLLNDLDDCEPEINGKENRNFLTYLTSIAPELLSKFQTLANPMSPSSPADQVSSDSTQSRSNLLNKEFVKSQFESLINENLDERSTLIDILLNQFQFDNKDNTISRSSKRELLAKLKELKEEPLQVNGQRNPKFDSIYQEILNIYANFYTLQTNPMTSVSSPERPRPRRRTRYSKVTSSPQKSYSQLFNIVLKTNPVEANPVEANPVEANPVEANPKTINSSPNKGLTTPPRTPPRTPPKKSSETSITNQNTTENSTAQDGTNVKSTLRRLKGISANGSNSPACKQLFQGVLRNQNRGPRLGFNLND